MTEPATPVGFAEPAPPGPRTDTDTLRAALADPHPAHRSRRAYLALTAVLPHAARLLAAPNADLACVISRCAHPRNRGQLTQSRYWVACDLLHAMVLALCSAPDALAQLSDGTRVTLTAGERFAVQYAAYRQLLVTGIPLTEPAQRHITDVALDALRRATAAH